MPKRCRNLYNQIHDFKNLHLAYLKARRNKRYREEVLNFSIDLEENLIGIQKDLRTKNYRIGRYREFKMYEPKLRIIKALPFRDRVVHHALCNIVEPIFDKVFIFDSYACRTNKGTHIAADRVTYFLRRLTREKDKIYCLKCDVKNYFGSINHKILLGFIKKKIADEDVLWLTKEIIYADIKQLNFLSTGIPIGNLTSQLFANLYLNELDYFVKHELKCKYYLRYMDDFLVLHKDKQYLNNTLKQIKEFLETKLGLELNNRTSIFPSSQGIDFVGYRTWPDYRLLRKSSVKRMKKRLKLFQRLWKDDSISLKEIRCSLGSWLGHAKHANTYNLRKRLLEDFSLGE